MQCEMALAGTLRLAQIILLASGLGVAGVWVLFTESTFDQIGGGVVAAPEDSGYK